MTFMKIEDIRLSWLQIPLATPYKLAFGSVAHFDTVLVELAADGRSGVGEATILNGYTDEDVEGSWALAQSLSERLCGLSIEAARHMLEREVRPGAPFTATAFLTAMDQAVGHPMLDLATHHQVPLLHGINATDPAGIEREIEAAIASGYWTLKVKVGFDLEADLTRVALIQRLVRGRATLRIDANQGYDRERGVAFASRVSPESIQLLEQPCHAKDWDAAHAVAQVSAVPLMLDESIYDAADIDRAARIGARFVKLKLMKFGSLDSLADGLARIRALGMTPILGNGVASDIGCWMEACVASAMIDNAGEMNGFLRQKEGVVARPVPVVDGAIQIEPGFVPSLDRARVNRFTVDRVAAQAPAIKEKAS